MIAFRILSPHVTEFGFRNLGNFCLWNPEFEKFFSLWNLKSRGTIHSTKIRPGKVVHLKRWPFFRNFSGWTEPVHRALDLSFRKFWSNGSRPWALKSGIQLKEFGIAPMTTFRNPEVQLTKNPECSSGNPDYHTDHGQSTVKTSSFILIQAFPKKN